ncbi:GFA family protein [Chelativorans sp.]|uniref:GFA family protein n=1 Tax=Chelativorans sp. TaxID=2203393 RepID=UPI002811BC0A|nr:GFA family protein [Chelativorans sp.]
MKIDGQCHCGHVTYEAEIDPERVHICHCDDCQRLTGSPYRVSVQAARSDIRLTGNPPRVYTKTGESGRKRRQYFCPECGSPVFVCGEDPDQGDWGIRWGSINQRRGLSPKRQMWCRSAIPWAASAFEDLPQRETQ